MKIDVSGLKKVASDDKTSTFITKKGHQFIVAHKGLSPGHKKHLDSIPHYASGGGVSEEDTSRDTYSPDSEAPQVIAPPQAPEAPPEGEISQKEKDYRYYKAAAKDDPYYAKRASELEAELHPAPVAQENPYTAVTPPLGANQEKYKAEMGGIRQQEGPVPGDDAPADSTGGQPEEALPQQNEPPQAAIQGDRSLAQEADKDKAAQETYQKGFADYHRENAQKLGAEDAAWQHDLQNGHVTPETYHDLFAKRDTLGKVGMLFGLLVSGAGSGLAHQSNAVMDAMNKEIENDFNAQKQSKDNAQNFLKIHQQQALNDANIALTKSEIPLKEAQTKSALAEASINAQAATMMKMNRTALHNLVLQVQKMPPGPQKSQAEAALAMVSAGVDQKNFDIADVAAGKAAMAKMLGGGNTTLLRTMPGMEGVANDIDAKKVPGVGQAQVPVPQNKRDELEAMNVLDYKAKDLLDFAKKNKGSIDPKVRAVGAQKAEEMMNYYNNSIKGGVLTEGRLKWLDQQIKKNPTSIFQDVLGNNSRMQEIMESNGQRRNLMLSNLGAPTQKAAPEKHVSKSGREMVQKNGKWYYK